MKNIEIGKIGESYAEKYLISMNYQIIKTNYRCRFGEIDLIAFDWSKKQLAFIEVKTRTSNLFGLPQDSITFRKKQKIIKTLLHYLSFTKGKNSLYWRVDVIAIKLDGKMKPKLINHIKNIFDG